MVNEGRAADAFVADVRGIGIERAEQEAAEIFQSYKDYKLCGLLVPHDLGGADWSASCAAKFIMELGEVGPSVALGAVMHNFSIAGLSASWRYGGGALAPFLRSVEDQQLLVSSGFAELGLSSSLIKPSMTAKRDGSGWKINGVKRPCSLSLSMDLLTASVWLDGDEQEHDSGYAVALIDARTPGIRVEKLWRNHVLEGAQSDAVILENVYVRDHQLIRPNQDMAAETAVLQVVGMNWFLIMVLSAYVGMARRLVDELAGGSTSNDFSLGAQGAVQRLTSAVRGCQIILDMLSRDMDRGELDPHEMQRRLLDARTSIECIFKVIAAETPDIMRGEQFITNGVISRLRESLSGLLFHPPARNQRYTLFEAVE
mgnify:CR=1 FL=1|jgi:isobutylamine N-hydroxylase